MAVLPRSVYKKVEWHLYHYFDIKSKVKEYRENVLHSGQPCLVVGSGDGRHSDPTAVKALKLTDIERYEKWIEVIETVIKRYQGTEKGKLLQMRYFDECGERHICSKLHIERTTYFTWKSEIVLYTALVAAQYGLIKVDKTA